MLIGLYFGSFNPVHTGHLIISSFIVNYTKVEQLWFIVSPQNPLKKAASLLNEYQRLHLVRIAIENDPLLKWSDVEFKLPRPSYTCDTLAYLEEKYPQHTFAMIMGSDSFQNLNKWKNGETLLKKYEFFIYERIGETVENPPANATLLKAPVIEISSTEIRKAIRDKKSIRYLVPENVREEIEKGNYYKH